jgi:hypothetical protein
MKWYIGAQIKAHASIISTPDAEQSNSHSGLFTFQYDPHIPTSFLRRCNKIYVALSLISTAATTITEFRKYCRIFSERDLSSYFFLLHEFILISDSECIS